MKKTQWPSEIKEPQYQKDYRIRGRMKGERITEQNITFNNHHRENLRQTEKRDGGKEKFHRGPVYINRKARAG